MSHDGTPVVLPRPQATPAGTFTAVAALDVALDADGVQGLGRARCLDAGGAADIAAAVGAWVRDERLAAVLHGPARGRARAAAWAPVWDEVAPTAPAGVPTLALAALDEAVWALAAAEGDAPPAGGRAAVVAAPLYWSGLWLHSTRPELVDEARWAVAAGFDAVKLRVDGGRVGASIDRARAVGAVLPPGRRLALELAGSGTPDGVVELTAALGPEQVLWVEDPLPCGPDAELRALTDRLDVAVATGEDHWGLAPLQALVAATGTAVPIVDLGRIGGPSGLARFLDAGAVARSEVGVHIDALAAAVVVARATRPVTVWLEVFDWWERPDPVAIRARAAG